MNLPKSFASSRRLVRTHARAAFTLAEMLIAVACFLLLVAAIVSSTLFGMRLFQISQTKLLVTNNARQAVAHMTDEIRSCETTYVGDVNTNGIFTGRTNGSQQIGNALLIYPTTNLSNYIIYFLNPLDKGFRRTSTYTGKTSTLASSVTNTPVFQVQDYKGNVQTNNSNNRVIRCTLQFFSGTVKTPLADSYTLDTAITRRGL